MGDRQRHVLERRRALTGIDPLTEILARLAAHDARITALEATAPRDAADADLAHVIARTTEHLPFTSADLLRHAATEPALTAALLEVGLQTPDELGAWLRDRAGTRAGITCRRLRGRKWLVTTDTSDT